ncbi:hypothetical protein BDZ97DRAFT_460844 [Flammula alnicola]|nr:hypothetical protein BDZ97DRAFT_460844 [Flammula alnicola]
MLSNAKNVIITGGTFTSQGHTDATTDGRRGIEILTSKIAPGAFHNAAERYDPPKCHPHTRTAVLKKIMEWIDDPVNLACFLWLYGPAGSGKSAIAQSIAEMCFKANKLAASFFFSRTVAGRNNETLFITTIVYQLILSIPEIHARVAKTLERDPLLLSRSLEAQLQALVIQPLSEAALDENDAISLKSRPRLVIVDGLDECGEPKSQFYILTTISTVVKQLAFPLIFLIASRPEQLIRQAFNNDLLNSLTTRLVLDDTYQPDADIKIFVESKIHDIKRNHPASAHFPPSWPSEIDIDRLVEKSSGQFIYISTVMKFLESHRHSPQDRLNIVFGISPLDNNMNTPFAELDALYHQIFSLVADLDKVFEVLIVLLFAYRVEKTPRSVEEFLSCSPGTLYILLSDLHSVISLPSPEDGGIIHFFHASLSDFLFDHARSGKLFIDSDIAQEFVVTCLLKRIKVDEGSFSFRTPRKGGKSSGSS